jgi:hypothetical protein
VGSSNEAAERRCDLSDFQIEFLARRFADVTESSCRVNAVADLGKRRLGDVEEM